jgi:hypothetical protein
MLPRERRVSVTASAAETDSRDHGPGLLELEQRFTLLENTCSTAAVRGRGGGGGGLDWLESEMEADEGQWFMTVVRVRGEAATANKERRKERQRVGIVGCSRESIFSIYHACDCIILVIADCHDDVNTCEMPCIFDSRRKGLGGGQCLESEAPPIRTITTKSGKTKTNKT